MSGKKVYVLAVSGGVDSVVLLDMVMASPPENTLYVVAHFDHGIRSDAASDAAFVQKLAQRYGCTYEEGRGKLGPGASEAEARAARYTFLREVAKKYTAEKIITAHHEDDFLETIIMNILRGRGVASLRPMHGQADILRPFLRKTKQEIIEYAQQKNLEWREDSTNTDTSYLRNYVRLSIMPKLQAHRSFLLAEAQAMDERLFEIETRVRAHLPRRNLLYRPAFVRLPWIVQLELVRQWLEVNGITYDKKKLILATIAIKTLAVGKQFVLNESVCLLSMKKNVLLTRR